MQEVFSKIRTKISSLAGNDLRKIGSGCFRTVYMIQSSKFGEQYKGKVLKVAKHKSGREANSGEMRTWMTVKGTELEKFFCPIYDRSENFQFIIMENVKTNGANRSTERYLRQEICSRMDNVDIPIDTQDFLDIKADNIGFYKGDPVMIDYPYGANFKRRSIND